MPSNATSRRQSSASDGATQLSSNRPQVQATQGPRKASVPPGLSTPSVVPQHTDAPSTLSSSATAAKAPSTTIGSSVVGNSAATRKPTRTTSSLRKGGGSTTPGTTGGVSATPRARSTNASPSSSATPTSANPSSVVGAPFTETPRAASTAHSPSSSATSSTAAATRKPRTTGAAGSSNRGPRFTQPTVSSRAHLPSNANRASIDAATSCVGTNISPSNGTPEQELPRSTPFARGSAAGSRSETASQKSAPHGSSGAQRGYNAVPAELKATAMQQSSSSSSASTVRENKDVAPDTRSGNTLVAERTEEARCHPQRGAAPSPSPTSPSTHRTTDPPPTIGSMRRKSHLPAETRESSQPLRSTPTTPVSTPVLTSAEARSTSIPSAVAPSTHPQTGLPMGIDFSAKASDSPHSFSHRLPRAPVAVSRTQHRAHSTPPAQRIGDGAVVQQTPPSSATKVSSAFSTPVRSPKVQGPADAIPSPPPPSRPTAAPCEEETSPVVYQIPVTEMRSSANVSLSSRPRSLSASVASGSHASRCHGSEDSGGGGGHRSSSPCSPTQSLSSKKTLELGKPRSHHTVTPLSTNDLSNGGRTSAGETKAAAATPSEIKRRSPHRHTLTASTGILVPATPESVNGASGLASGVGLSSSCFANIIETDSAIDAHGESGESGMLARSAPASTLHRSSSPTSSILRGTRSVGDRSRSPAREQIATLLEDLQVLRQREEEAAQRGEPVRRKQEEEEEEKEEAEAEAVAQRSHRKTAAAVKGCAVTDADVDELGAFLFVVEAGVDGEEDDERGRPSRATDTTGHAPITPRLRRRIEQEQERELELLRTITQERHPENVELLDLSDDLIRELGCIDADMDPAEAEEALRSFGSEEEEDEGEEDVVSDPTLPKATSKVSPTPPPKKQPVATAKSTKASLSTTGEKENAAAAPAAATRKPLAVSEPRTRRNTEADAATALASAKAAEKAKDASRSHKANLVVARSEAANGKKAESSAASASPPAGSAPPHGHASPPSSRGRQISTSENKNNNIGGGGGAKFGRHSSRAGANSEAPATGPRGAAAGGATHAREALKSTSAAVVAELPEHRRRTLPEGMLGGGGGAGGPVNASSNAVGYSPRAVQRHASLPTHQGDAVSVATTTSQSDRAAAIECLLPPLISPQEAAHTVTIVFDLDETLCNNRCLGGTVLRPGAELLLHTLRSLAPSPRYKLIDTRARGQHATNRLYDQAMFKMGMTPLYRPRVAQRQASGGYHANVVGGSTGEARPATTKEINPLRIELVLWTASEESLARRAMRRLDPHNAIFDEAIYRDLRWYRDSYYTKELSRLGRPMQRVVIIENSVESVIRNRQNAILVTSFITSRLDRQLFLVREVLRDWIRGMKANLAYTLEHDALKPQPQYSDDRGSAAETHLTGSHDSDVVRHDGDDHELEEPHEEGGESPEPPRSLESPSQADGSSSSSSNSGRTNSHNAVTRDDSNTQGSSIDDGTSESANGNGSSDDSRLLPPTSDGEPAPHLTAPAPTPKVAVTSPLTLSNSGLGTSTNSTGSAPRVLNAMAQRAANIVQFLHRHRLVLAETNYINFQMTGEVMMRLQSTETALITAALPPSAEAPAVRAVRSAPCGPASRTLRTSRAVPPPPTSTAFPAAAAAAAAGDDAAYAQKLISATTAAAHGGPAPRSDAANANSFDRSAPTAASSTTKATARAAGKTSAICGSRENQRPGSAAADSQDVKGSVRTGAPANEPNNASADRPQRVSPTAAKRQIA